MLPGNQLPETHRLYAAFPNPFNAETRIQFALSNSGEVNLSIMDLQGRFVRTLVKETVMQKGIYTYRWDGKDNNGEPLTSGIYYILFKAGTFRTIQKVTLLK